MSRKRRRNKNKSSDVIEQVVEKELDITISEDKVEDVKEIETEESISDDELIDIPLDEYIPDSDLEPSKNYLVRVLKNKRFNLVLNILAFPAEVVLCLLDKIVALVKFIINIGGLLAIVGCIAGVLLLAKVYPQFQEAREIAYDKLATVSEDDFHLLSNTVVYDNKDKKIGEITSNNFKYVEITDISMLIQNGYIAIEDKHFKTHCGIDLQALTRAGIALVKNDGEITQGGSTITQQVVKNALLSQERTFSRKLIEVLVAPSLEKKFSKEKIMEFYCNTNYYGNQCYGVEAASKFYFGKKAKNLSLEEAAVICGISNAPNDYNPVDNYALALKRRNIVLDKMLKEGFISKEECETAKATDIVLADTNTEQGGVHEDYMVSYAIHCTAIELMKQDGFEFKYVFANMEDYDSYTDKYKKLYAEKSSAVRAGGYKIYTSFNKDIQESLQNTIDNGLSGYTGLQENGKYDLQGAAVCIDNSTGLVVAMVGGRGSEDEFNRAFLAQRQPGSTIKPLLDYAPALDVGVVSGGSTIKDEKIEGAYSPKNSGGKYSGNVTVREALARSINTIAYKLFTMVGSQKALSYLDKMHFTSLSPVDNDALSISLGGFTNGLTVVDMAKGYFTLENGGTYNDKTCLVKVTFEKSDKDIYDVEKNSAESQIYNKDTAFIISDLMQGTFKEGYGTAHGRNNSSQIYAGKTGTTSDNKDAWFCGYSAYYTTSVWVGCDTPRVMSGMYGGTKPLELWANFMNSLHSDLAKKDFEKPSTVTLKKFSHGEFGDDVDVDSSKEYYGQRRSGTEWYSDLLSTSGSAYLANIEAQSAYSKAVELVEIFERFTVSTIEEALQLDKLYKECMNACSNCTDNYDMAGLKKRAKDHYDALIKVVEADWSTVISEYNAGVSEQQAKQNKIDADNASLAAKETLKNNRVAKVNWYIDKILGRQYYNSVTKLLIKDAKTALSRCKGYDEYKDLSSRLSSAEEYAKGLPEEPKYNDIPENGFDKDTNYQDNYIDNPTPNPPQPEATTEVQEPITEQPESTTEVITP